MTIEHGKFARGTGVDPLQPGTSAWHRRQAIWRHNSFKGSARMMMSNCQSIMQAETTTAETRDLAQKIWSLAVDLGISLDKRIDKPFAGRRIDEAQRSQPNQSQS